MYKSANNPYRWDARIIYVVVSIGDLSRKGRVSVVLTSNDDGIEEVRFPHGFAETLQPFDCLKRAIYDGEFYKISKTQDGNTYARRNYHPDHGWTGNRDRWEKKQQEKAG